jgi:hypothetical protein
MGTSNSCCSLLVSRSAFAAQERWLLQEGSHAHGRVPADLARFVLLRFALPRRKVLEVISVSFCKSLAFLAASHAVVHSQDISGRDISEIPTGVRRHVQCGAWWPWSIPHDF